MTSFLAILGASMLYLIGVGSFILALAALGFSVYNYLQQRRKNELRNLAEDLQSVIDGLEFFHTTYNKPFENENLYFAIRDLGRDILAFHHHEGKPAPIEMRGISRGIGEDEKRLDDAEEVLNEVESGELLRLVLSIDYDGGEVDLTPSYWVGDIYRVARSTMPRLNGIEEEYRGLLTQFEPGLIEETTQAIERLILKSASHALGVKSPLEMDPTEYETPNEMAEAVYGHFLYYDGVEEDLDELNTVLTRLDELRVTILQTSYS